MAGKLTHPSRDRAIVDLAARQRGLVTAAQLETLGVGRRTVERWVASGRLRRVHRGVYVFGSQPLTRHGRWLAAVMAKAPAVLSHESAAALWGLAGDRRDIDVTASHGRRGLNGSGVRLHASKLRRDEWVAHEGIPVTTVARTLFDLAEAIERPQLKSAWDEAAASASSASSRSPPSASATRPDPPAPASNPSSPPSSSTTKSAAALPSRTASPPSSAPTACPFPTPTSWSTATRSTPSGPPPA